MTAVKTFYFKNEKIQSLLLKMGQQRATQSLFKLIVDHLCAFDEVALARIWLVREGDICSSCLLADECQSREKCLHLVASRGHSIVHAGEDWSSLDGRHRRFPMGARKVGHIAATGKPVVVESVLDDSTWIAHPDWAREEGINGFAGYPMLYHGTVLGVLAVFTKTHTTQPALDILGIIANHAASALANAMAFETIQGLTRQLKEENTYLREELYDAISYGGFIGRSKALQRVIGQIDLVAQTDASVLILGESGTGKELVARELHQRSGRSKKPLIKVNCASIPKELFASEFFGHAKGAFTGAFSDREGKFGAAHQGTLFLDEVGEIPLEQQAQLLRVLQEGEYERVGEEKLRKVDARIIVTTNRDLKKQVEDGKFREDLYFRLNVFPITVPPLRERKEDVPLLANHFLERSLTSMNRPVFKFDQEQIGQLVQYDWPGNVRELQNIVERFAITAHSDSARLEILSSLCPDADRMPQEISLGADRAVITEEEMVKLQVRNMETALALCRGRIYGPDGAAALLGLKPTTLATRMKKLNIRRIPD